MYKQGDILLIPIPFSDLTSSKKRPVLVLSNDDYNCKTEDIIVAAITSNMTTKDYTVMLSSSDLCRPRPPAGYPPRGHLPLSAVQPDCGSAFKGS